MSPEEDSGLPLLKKLLLDKFFSISNVPFLRDSIEVVGL